MPTPVSPYVGHGLIDLSFLKASYWLQIMKSYGALSLERQKRQKTKKSDVFLYFFLTFVFVMKGVVRTEFFFFFIVRFSQYGLFKNLFLLFEI